MKGSLKSAARERVALDAKMTVALHMLDAVGQMMAVMPGRCPQFADSGSGCAMGASVLERGCIRRMPNEAICHPICVICNSLALACALS